MLKLVEESENKLVTFEGKQNFLFILLGFFVVCLGILATSEVEQVSSVGVMQMAAILVVITGFGLYMIASTRVEIDRSAKIITYTKATLFRTKVRVVPFSDVHHVEARRQWVLPAGSRGSGVRSQVLSTSGVIVLQTGEELLISVQQGSNDLSDNVQGVTTLLAEKMATYIGVPCKDILPADASQKPGVIIS